MHRKGSGQTHINLLTVLISNCSLCLELASFYWLPSLDPEPLFSSAQGWQCFPAVATLWVTSLCSWLSAIPLPVITNSVN